MPPQQNPEHANRLVHATSPYLLQHAHNPVDWHEWGAEAFETATREDKPIFLSIGYSACHWCHVMEHESFDDRDVAALINDRFVCIKVDREERPDVDEIYMQVTQMLNNGQGGWPMSLFLTPQRRPIYAGTYFPREQFMMLCDRVSELWQTERERVLNQGDQIQAYLQQWAQGQPPDESLVPLETVDRIADLLARHFDPKRGGFQTEGNKFPPSMAMELMLRVHHRTQQDHLLDAVRVTLDNMARGGIYDHLGGGICRYSTDPDWLVPHFEKMLYDQALVSGIYLDAFQVTRDPLHAYVAGDIFNYVISDLQAPEGGFFSARDADSEGLEGAYYVWTVEQVRDVLGAEDADLFCKYFDVTAEGNWFEHRGHAPAGPKNILHVSKPKQAFARLHNLRVEELEEKLESWRPRMLAARARRTPPGLDDKILTAWNGLMVASLAKGARVLDAPRYAEAASKAADFILTHLRDGDRLLRTHRGGVSRLKGYLTDCAFLIEGLLNLHEATFEARWLREAISLNDALIRHYHDPVGGGFFFTADDGEKLIARSKSPRDGAIPSGNSVQAMNLLRLAVFCGDSEYQHLAEGLFRAFKPLVEQSPGQFDRLLCAVDMHHARVAEVAIVGRPDEPATRELVRTVFDPYLPNKVVTGGIPGVQPADDNVLLKDKVTGGDESLAYVCEDRVCGRPVSNAADLASQLTGKNG